MKKGYKKSLLICLVLIIGLAVLSGCSQNDKNVNADTSRVITDMAGRELTIPNTINKAGGVGPVDSIFIYTINPDKLLGWNFPLNDYEKEYILTKYHDLEAYGMSKNFNTEAIIKAGPEIMIMSGGLNDATIESANNLQEKLGIPVVVIDGEITNSAKTYTFLGEVLNEKAISKKINDYISRIFDAVGNAQIDEKDKVTTYYGNGANSLNTAPKGTSASVLFDIVNAENVISNAGTKGRVDISLEQIISYNPEIMIINGEPLQQLTGKMAVEKIMNDPDFANITAVKNSNVYVIPKSPFSWFDRPSGPNRIIGIPWLSELVYPNHFNFDIMIEVKEFYSLFYHVELSDEEVNKLLNIDN